MFFSLAQGERKGKMRRMMKRNRENAEVPCCMFRNPFSDYSHTIGEEDLTLWELRNRVCVCQGVGVGPFSFQVHFKNSIHQVLNCFIVLLWE